MKCRRSIQIIFCGLLLVWGYSILLPPEALMVNEVNASAAPNMANIISVKVRGGSGSYTFSVEISSPDTGCNQYADWWEVISEDGKLLYRRILAHSHADEQPFIRSGGPVKITSDTIVWVRAHMHPGGYGGIAFKGSVKDGFKKAPLSPKFAGDAANLPPLPEGCDF